MAKQASPKQGSSRSSLYKLLKVPLKILCKAGDFYFKSMEVYGNNGMVLPTAAPQVSTCTSNNFELRRASSTRSFGNKQQAPSVKNKGIRTGPNSMVPRSRSVNIGRIDEDEPCDDFGDAIKTRELVYPRSRSHAVVHRTRA